MAGELERNPLVGLELNDETGKRETSTAVDSEVEIRDATVNWAIYNTGRALWERFGPALLAEEEPQQQAVSGSTGRLALDAGPIRLALEPPEDD